MTDESSVDDALQPGRVPPIADDASRGSARSSGDAFEDEAPLPGTEEMDLRARMVVAEERIAALRAAIGLLALGIALLAVIAILHTRKARSA